MRASRQDEPSAKEMNGGKSLKVFQDHFATESDLRGWRQNTCLEFNTLDVVADSDNLTRFVLDRLFPNSLPIFNKPVNMTTAIWEVFYFSTSPKSEQETFLSVWQIGVYFT